MFVLGQMSTTQHERRDLQFGERPFVPSGRNLYRGGLQSDQQYACFSNDDRIVFNKMAQALIC